MHPISAVQSEYSLFTRDVEESVLPVIRELGIGFVAYSPLGRGILTGSVTADTLPDGDIRRTSFPRFAEDNLEANVAIANAVVGELGRGEGPDRRADRDRLVAPPRPRHRSDSRNEASQAASRRTRAPRT